MSTSASFLLPPSINCVLARRNPVELALELRAAQQDMRDLVGTLGASRTYLYPRHAEDCHQQAKALARELRRIKRGLYTGSCVRIRAHRRLGGFISVRARDVLYDGGLADIARGVAQVPRAFKNLRSREPFYVRVRDREMAGARSHMREFGEALDSALRTVVVDLSAADLSSIAPDEVRLPRIIWSSKTIWPNGMDKRKLAHSRKLSDGVYEA